MKGHKLTDGLSEVIKFLMTNEPRFRYAVFYLPLASAIGAFILHWLVFDRTLSQSLYASIFMFFLYQLFGLGYEAKKRGKLR